MRVADGLDGGHVDPMVLTALELGERVLLVAQVNHEHGVRDVDVQMLFGQAEESRSAFHVAHDAVGVGGALDEQFASAQEKVELPAENLFGVMRLRVSHWV